MDISLGTLLHYLWGFFQFTHSQPFPPPPPPPPHKQLWTCVSTSFFSRDSTLYRLVDRELQESFEKDAQFYEGNRKGQKIMNTASLSHGFLSRIVAPIRHRT